ncbi:LysR family transcriptional regulator [Pseudomonas sp. NPDC008258]|uniref:LysR family transcriptional regulator n=1 Tax=Pseudomonas sp. NPDC008258 TaxID=3364418 RepID=UPI0036E59AE7
MVKHTEPDQSLIQIPSLRAVKAFVAAAKHQNFTRAAESLCVTQAAVSRQIKDLEAFLGTDLFVRAGRAVELTEAGALFFDAVQLSLSNISQASARIRRQSYGKRVVTLCCSPAFSALWLVHRLPRFLAQNPDIDLNLVTTQNFFHMEPGVRPDIVVSKVSTIRDGYHSHRLVHDIIYPVCTPQYLKQHPEAQSLEGIKSGPLLNLSPYGRAQVAEHVDWFIWFEAHGLNLEARLASSAQFLNVNDYNAMIMLTLAHQGVALGWHYLVDPLVQQGLLVRPVDAQLEHKESQHFLSFSNEKVDDSACCRLRDWILENFE